MGRAKVLWEEAEKRGLEMREVRIFTRNTDMYVVRKSIPGTRKKEIMTFSGVPRPKSADTANLSHIDDKSYFKKMCQKEWMPYAEWWCALSLREAYTIFDRLKKPVIVKPRLWSRGRHTLTYINTREELRKAYKIAKQLCLWVIVEEQLFWPVYRGTVINYKLEGIFAAKVPQIMGDGTTNIRELISQKNLTRLEGIAEVKISAKMAWFLVRQCISNGSFNASDGYDSWYIPLPKKGTKDIFDYVPAKDTVIYLSEKIGMDYGGISGDEYDICHPDTMELFEKAGHVFNDTLLGFDLMIPDISRSWKEQKCGLLEANTAPFFNLHHDPFYGKPRNIAAKVWDMIDWK